MSEKTRGQEDHWMEWAGSFQQAEKPLFCQQVPNLFERGADVLAGMDHIRGNDQIKLVRLEALYRRVLFQIQLAVFDKRIGMEAFLRALEGMVRPIAQHIRCAISG